MLKMPVAFQRTTAVAASHIWFAEKPEPGDALKFATYFHCKCTGPVKGFTRDAKFTKLVNLARTDEAIQKDFQKNTQYEVRRAQKEGLTFGTVGDAETFVAFYDGFAATKEQDAIDPQVLGGYWPSLIITQMSNEAGPLVMHAYVADKSIGRANLWRSASHFRCEDGEGAQLRRRLIGRANRLLTFRDMTWLREQGFAIYDFGGYAANTTDPALQRINEFKDSFGGRLVEESDYTAAAIALMRRVKSTLSRTTSPSSVPNEHVGAGAS